LKAALPLLFEPEGVVNPGRMGWQTRAGWNGKPGLGGMANPGWVGWQIRAGWDGKLGLD
jgi:hypothetical protein